MRRNQRARGSPRAHDAGSRGDPASDQLARRPAQEAAKVVRAAENMVFVISANVAGRHRLLASTARCSADARTSSIISAARWPMRTPLRRRRPCLALIDVEELRAARKKDTGTANPLLRARWEMYRPFFAAASFYPPNQFPRRAHGRRDSAKPDLPPRCRTWRRPASSSNNQWFGSEQDPGETPMITAARKRASHPRRTRELPWESSFGSSGYRPAVRRKLVADRDRRCA